MANLGGWLTTVVARVCLDMLRARKSRREAPMDDETAPSAAPAPGPNPEQELALADVVHDPEHLRALEIRLAAPR